MFTCVCFLYACTATLVSRPLCTYLHTSSPWFSSHLAIMKRSLRKLERKINMSPSHKSKFLIARKAYKHELNLHKTSYYESKCNACGNDTRQIFKMANSILGTNIKSKSTALPDAALCSSFVSSLSISSPVSSTTSALNWRNYR